MSGPSKPNNLVRFLLVAAMAVCLPITMAGEAVALAFDGKPLGNDVGTAADVFGWLFAAAFLAVFVMMIVEQDRKYRRRGPGVARSTAH